MTDQEQLVRRVRPFSEFSRIMSQVSSLKAVNLPRRDDLLRKLYDLADLKVITEGLAAQQRHKLVRLRKQRRRISRVRARFCEAARYLEEACKACGVEITAGDAHIGDVFGPGNQVRIAVATEKRNGRAARRSRTLAEAWAACSAVPAYLLAQGGKIRVAGLIAKYLRNSAEEASTQEQRLAAIIPPSQRRGTEIRLARKFVSHFYGGVEPDARPQPGPKAKAIDRWFIGAAASCLDEYQISQGGQVRIIARLFAVGLGDVSRSEESIRKQLRRHRERRSEFRLAPATDDLRLGAAQWMHGARDARFVEDRGLVTDLLYQLER